MSNPIEYNTGDWNKRLDFESVIELQRTDYPGWDRNEEDKLMTITVDFLWPKEGDPQREMLVWADDNNEGYFYEGGVRTEGGTVVVREGDKVSISFVFQLREDAMAFKLRWL